MREINKKEEVRFRYVISIWSRLKLRSKHRTVKSSNGWGKTSKEMVNQQKGALSKIGHGPRVLKQTSNNNMISYYNSIKTLT